MASPKLLTYSKAYQSSELAVLDLAMHECGTLSRRGLGHISPSRDSSINTNLRHIFFPSLALLPAMKKRQHRQHGFHRLAHPRRTGTAPVYLGHRACSGA